jgi:flagellar L-ring protein FlgH
MIRATSLRAATLAVALFAQPVIGSTQSASADSMFDESTYRSLVASTKAFGVGDLLTVIVQEAASAVSSADLRAQRNFTLSGRAGSSNGRTHSASAGTESESDGVGRTQRTGRLLAQLSVRVTGVNEVGDLIVSGQQVLRINSEEQLITLSRLVRPRDIAVDNTVMSSRIAEARIEFDGKGFVTRQSRPSWAAWLLSFLGL